MQSWRGVVWAMVWCGALVSGCSGEPAATPQAAEMTTLDMAEAQDMAAQDMAGAQDMTASDDLGAQDMARDMAVVDMGGSNVPSVIRGRFESAGPIRRCGDVATWNAPDGFLLRPNMGVCGDDMQALADTIVASLDAAKARDARVMLVIGQGLDLPSSWLSACETFMLNTPNFSGTSCVPWDTSYQAKLREALVDVIGPKVKDHPALAGVYFTISSMTNGSELHFRTTRAAMPDYPGDAAMRQAYLDVMDIFQSAFDVPVVFEGGHCLWSEQEDCETPLALYKHARDTYGVARTGVAMWNCAERFFVSESSPEFHARPLIELASQDGASIGCQTVGSFAQACRFTSAEVADYGTSPSGPGAATCPDSDASDVERACVDTLGWFTGTTRQSPDSMVVRGTWGVVWSKDVAPGGVYKTSAACRAAIDALTP